MIRPSPRRGTATALLVLAVAGCGTPGVTPDRSVQATDREHQQATEALARWDDAVQASDGRPDFVPTSELTGQIGDWELAVGDNNKSALMAGLLEAGTDLPADAGTGVVTWDDGTSTTVETLSAKDAFADLRRTATSTCPECTPLVVIAARLSTVRTETSRGPATAPAWEFGIAGTSVLVTRVAVGLDTAVNVVPPPWNADDPPVGLSIDSAAVTADGRQMTVSFIGAPGSRDEQCGADYTAEAVESDLAVVVIVTEHANPFGGACTLVGAVRTAIVDLARPLARRTVLEVREGRPVPVTTVP